MLKSLTSAVSGLKNFTTMLDVLGNNLANVRTLGFKGSRVTFSETQSLSLAGASRGVGGGFGNQKQLGLGMIVSSTDLDFTQGSLEFTGTPTDLAIQGNSFFVLSDGQSNRYTRAGNFFFNSLGTLVNPNGLAVMGWRADASGEINTSAPLTEVLLDKNLRSPAAETATVFLSGNFDATLIPKANTLLSASTLTKDAGETLAVGGDDLNDLDQTAVGLVSGDVINIVATKPNGDAVSATFTYTGASGGKSIDDLLAVINIAFGGDAVGAGGAAVAILVDGKIEFEDVLNNDGTLFGTSLEASETSTALKLDPDDANTGTIRMPAFEVSQAGFTGTVSTSTVVFDGLGGSHNVVVSFTKTAEPGEWRWVAELADGGEAKIADGTDAGTIQFNEAGEVIDFDVTGPAEGITIVPDPAAGAAQFTVEINVAGGSGFAGVTQFASDSTLIVRDQDGRPSGTLLRFDIDTQGIITGIFSNEENVALAQIALAEFPNPPGLLRGGSGLFEAAAGSGIPVIGAAGEQFSSSVISGSVEQSNVDLVRQFTDMITTQRAFQANARVVTTADQILEETLRLKR